MTIIFIYLHYKTTGTIYIREIIGFTRRSTHLDEDYSMIPVFLSHFPTLGKCKKRIVSFKVRIECGEPWTSVALYYKTAW